MEPPPEITCSPLVRRKDLGEPSLDRLARDRAGIHQAHAALRFDEQGRRHAVQGVALANLALLLVLHGEGCLDCLWEMSHMLHSLMICHVDIRLQMVIIYILVVY